MKTGDIAPPSLLHDVLTHAVRARPPPNLQDRKSLNFQEKIEQKSKVSKPSDVETVETGEDGEATRNGYYNRKVSLDSWTSISGVESLRGSQSLPDGF
jgi:hypothetical protein